MLRAHLTDEESLHDAVYIVTAVHEVAAIGVVDVFPDGFCIL